MRALSDRRWIFVAVAAALVCTVLWPLEQPVTPSPSVKKVYDFIDQLPEGKPVLIATDFDPQAKAELEPMTRALLHHCFQKNLKVIGMTFWVEGAPLCNRIFADVAAEYKKQSGKDYVYLGWKAGTMAQVITNMGESIKSTFPADADNQPTANMPIFKGVETLRDLAYTVDLAAGMTVDAWIIYGGDKYGFPMAAGCTAVSGPDMYVYINTGQLNGLIAGLRGAADYEVLLGRPGSGVQGMFAQSVVHAIIVVLVILANAVYFWQRRKAAGGKVATGD